MTKIELSDKFSIKRISHEDLKIIFEMSSNLRVDIYDIGESPFVVEQTLSEPIINSKNEIRTNTRNDIELYLAITLLRLFKKGFVTYSYIFPIKGNDFPFNICDPKLDNVYIERVNENIYDLNNIEVFGFSKFWQRFKKTLVKIRSNKKKWSNLKLALDRFNSSYYRPNDSDRLIDLSIAIEALFSKKEDISGSLQHKYALRLSRLLGSKLGNHKKIYTDMIDLYGIRSGIVHGNIPTAKLKRKTELLESYVRQALINYLVKVEENKDHSEILDEIDFK